MTGPGARKSIVINFAIIAVVVCCMLFFSTYGGAVELTEAQAFAPGININGFELGGLSYEQGSALVLENESSYISNFKIPVSFNGVDTVMGVKELGLKSNVSELLKTAYERNKSGDMARDFNDSVAADKSYRSVITADEGTVKRNLGQFISKNSELPVNASAKFDTNTRSFVFSDGSFGYTGDVDRASELIIAQVNNGDTTPVSIEALPVRPDITRRDLESNTAKIAYYETEAVDDEARNTNIRLICEAVDGAVIEPGATLSVNELAGRRTEEKGYKKAPAIVDGQLTDDVGGGICQLSGTLYNAALLADMEIVEREHHTFPSNYLPVGQDSTLNWDDKDLKIKNVTKYPIYVSAAFNNRMVQVTLYGQPLPENTTIEVVNSVIEELKPGSPQILRTPELAPGARQVKSKARKGYYVKVYRNYYVDGALTEAQLVSNDRYAPIAAVILEGAGSVSK